MNNSNMRDGFLFLGIGILSSLAASTEVLLMMLEWVFYGNGDFGEWTLVQSCLHWFFTCAVWGAASVGIGFLLKKKGFDVLERRERPTALRIFLLVCVVLTGILYMAYTWEFRFKPAVEWAGKIKRFGTYGGWAFFFQYLYYFYESMLITLIVVAGQEAGEHFFPSETGSKIPWGGIVCALTWGVMHTLSKDISTAIMCVVLSILFGISYLLVNKNFRLAFLATAIIFML